MFHKVTATTLFGRSVTFLLPWNEDNFYSARPSALTYLSYMPGPEKDTDCIVELHITEVGR